MFFLNIIEDIFNHIARSGPVTFRCDISNLFFLRTFSADGSSGRTEQRPRLLYEATPQQPNGHAPCTGG